MTTLNEKTIRAALHGRQRLFGNKYLETLLAIIDEQRGTIAMHEANADEAALKAARREAKIGKLESRCGDCQSYADTCVDVACAELDEDQLNIKPDDVGPCARLQIELRNLRAQLAEAHTAGHPVNLFEALAGKLTTAHKADGAGR